MGWRRMRDLFGVVLCLLAAHAYLDHTLMSAGLRGAPATHASAQMAGMDMPGMSHGDHPAGSMAWGSHDPAPAPAGHHGANCCPLCHVTALALPTAQGPPARPDAGYTQHARAKAPHDRPAARSHADARAPPFSA